MQTQDQTQYTQTSVSTQQTSLEDLQSLARLIRYWIVVMTTKAHSGHVTSSLSATDLMTGLFFGGSFHFDLQDIANHQNDRIIFSKGHASPLFYALWTAAGEVDEKELLSYRTLQSFLEGHPMPSFRMTEAATGSLGQGLSVGMGMALAEKNIHATDARIFVLMGDSEMAEGSVWETMNIASHYALHNLIAIVDVNRLGQRGETMFGTRIEEFTKRAQAFGWETMTIDGHDMQSIVSTFDQARKSTTKPVMILAHTVKGKGISFLEDAEGWHGKALNQEESKQAFAEIGSVDASLRGIFAPIMKIEQVEMSIIEEATEKTEKVTVTVNVTAEEDANEITEKKAEAMAVSQFMPKSYESGASVATREAYGDALVQLGALNDNIVVLDAEVSNSTFANTFQKVYPERFFEMYIAEQNMIGNAIGLSARGAIPCISTFAAFFSRAFDQLRMAAYSKANIKCIGSHAGVSIGEDGASQMGLEDIALFRSLFGSVVLYPSDAISTQSLLSEAVKHDGLVYIRTTRAATPQLYDVQETFPIGGSKVLRRNEQDALTLVAAGITLHEALKTADACKREGIAVRVIDVYSIKPLDQKTLLEAALETKTLITIEDHYQSGGLYESVSSALAHQSTDVIGMCVQKMPHSGSPQDLLEYEEISATAIQKKIHEVLQSRQ